ncbi:MAG: hypothetical protein MRERC_3c027 [Mycoplasmataceae bacterium RC_NB112A]|nr:MAG: hypothetical protein MRERC_3c027 [Mycoplasmataceae bacterium RC_NB112A]
MYKSFSGFTKSRKATLPTLLEWSQLSETSLNGFIKPWQLEQIRNKIKLVGNQRGEFKRKIHYGCYLLCSQAGLKVSEAAEFDLKNYKL